MAKGVVAYFKTPHDILAAAKAASSKGYKNVEAYTPFPIHGMEVALGIKPSIVPWATLVCGFTGFAVAMHMQVWTSAYNWPLNIGGKPLISGPAFIPILFELTVLLGGLGTAFFMIFLNGLPRMKDNPFRKSITDDRFALYIPLEGNNSDAEQFLKTLHPENVDVLTEQV
jgi:hypothetical protein